MDSAGLAGWLRISGDPDDDWRVAQTGQSAPKKVWCVMRKWVDRYWKSGMVPNPPRIAALFFDSLVPSRDDIRFSKTGGNSVRKAPKESPKTGMALIVGKQKLNCALYVKIFGLIQKLT